MTRWRNAAILSLNCALAGSGLGGSVLAQTATLEGEPSVQGETQAAGNGRAERYWMRTLGGQETLWLFIDGAWREFATPSAALVERVQDVFCDCRTNLEVVGWYDDATLTVVVVRSAQQEQAAKVVTVVNMIPSSFSHETWQDSEPFLAVDRDNAQNMVGTAFTRNPDPQQQGRAPIYVTDDGGTSWNFRSTVGSNRMTSDITVAGTARSARLHSGILKTPGSLLQTILRTDDFFSNTVMAETMQRQGPDQPFVQALRVGNGDRVYVGNNDLGVSGNQTASVDVSIDDGASFQTIRLEPRNTPGQDGPSVRPAISGDGTVYVAYFGWRSFVNNVATSDIVVVRDDQGAVDGNAIRTDAFTDLTDPSDGLPGRKVATGVTIPWSNAPTVGNERIGSTLSLAVHPNDSAKLCVAWADNAGGTVTYMAHVRCSGNRGVTWSNDLRTSVDTTPFSLGINDAGRVGFLFQQFTGGRWVTHLERLTLSNTFDSVQASDDTILADVPGNAPSPLFLPYIGDYNFVTAVGAGFRGVFSTNNTPDRDNFTDADTLIYQRHADFDNQLLLDDQGNEVAISIDPFYFSVE